ncbi:MAG: DUF6596 domain-containing protein [Myxococcota bacterium]
MKTAAGTAERAARVAFGRLVGSLAARGGDWAAAEDALGDALVRALERWPSDGVPERPEAWLLTVARRRLIDGGRRRNLASAREKDITLLEELRRHPREGAPDPRLSLLFVCAHPAIEPRHRAPLMLQLVLGLEARRIGGAFLVKPNTMGHRLVRAKAKIREARIPFEIPDVAEWPSRLESVLDAIYTAYSLGWDAAFGDDRPRLSGEALWLGRLIVELVPNQPEAMGLLALMLYCEARREARRDTAGAFVPLDDQDPTLWCGAQMREAESWARAAGQQLAKTGVTALGRYQLEAAIQALHAERGRKGGTDWESLTRLYAGLRTISPTAGALVGHAVASARASGPKAGLTLLDQLSEPHRRTYQPYWAARAQLLVDLGRPQEARSAYDRAIGLTEDAAVRRFLAERRERL